MTLNDPRWGRTGDDQTKPAQTGGETPKNEDSRGNRNRPPENDLDQLWDDFNKLLGGVLGGDPRARKAPSDSDGGNGGGGDDGGNKPPSPRRVPNFAFKAPKTNFKFLGLVFAAVVVLWAGTGFYIVPEG